MRGYDEKAPSKYIMYLDANNLYDWAMSQHLPTSGEASINWVGGSTKRGSRETTIRSIGVPLGKFYSSMVSKTLFSAFSSVFFIIINQGFSRNTSGL